MAGAASQMNTESLVGSRAAHIYRRTEVDCPHLIELKDRRLAGERPRCRLERVKLDLADMTARRALVRRFVWTREIGSRSLKNGCKAAQARYHALVRRHALGGQLFDRVCIL